MNRLVALLVGTMLTTTFWGCTPPCEAECIDRRDECVVMAGGNVDAERRCNDDYNSCRQICGF